MKKALILISILGFSTAAMAADTAPFSVTMSLFAPIAVTKINDLTFPAAQATTVADVPVATTDAGAATFSATGEPSKAFTASVVSSSISLARVGGGDPITVDTFVISQPAAFDVSGDAAGLAVGATAHVTATNIAGSYAGTNTFRIVY